MTLNQIAQQAMDYLDSVGVAADYDIVKPRHLTDYKLDVITDDFKISVFGSNPSEDSASFMMERLKVNCKQKSPA